MSLLSRSALLPDPSPRSCGVKWLRSLTQAEGAQALALNAMRSLICSMVLLAVSQPASAGGNHVLGRVTDFSGKDGSYRFVFTEHEANPALPLVEGCPSISVLVEYERVPWYSWLPWVASSHPTLEQTELAAAALSEASRSKKLIAFGYMGYGLVPAKEKCSVVSKGLLKISDVVLSFNGAV